MRSRNCSTTSRGRYRRTSRTFGRRCMRLMVLLVLLVLAGPDTQGQGPQVERIDVSEYGIYTSHVTGTTVDGAGVRHNTIGDPTLAATTRTVPLRQGILFGFRYT